MATTDTSNTVDLKTELDRLKVARINKVAPASASVRKVGLFGDSRAFLSHSGGGDGSGTQNNLLKGFGLAHWIQAYSEGMACLPWELQGGVAGDTTKQMLDRQPAFIEKMKAAGSDLVVVIGGTNDRTGNNLELGQSKVYMQTIVQNFQAAGIKVIVISDTPRGNGSSLYELTDAQAADHYAYHLWCENELSKVCAVVNAWDSWIDPNTGTKYQPLAKVIRDGIHPSKIGAMLIGKAVGPVVAAHVRQLAHVLESNVARSAEYPKGTLTKNPLVQGTAGSIASSANPVSGSKLADGWGAEGENMAGLTTTWSKEVDAGGVEWQVVKIAGTATSDQQPAINAYVDVNLSDLVDQDVIKTTGLVQSEGTGLSNISAGILITPSWTQKLDCDDSDSTLPWPSEASGVVNYETPELVYDASAGFTLVRSRIEARFPIGATVSATVKFAKFGMRNAA